MLNIVLWPISLMATKCAGPLTATATCLLRRWGKAIAAMLIVTMMCLSLLPPGSALAEDSSADADNSEGTGIEVASWALTVPYVIGKGAFALGGAVVGSLSYVFSGGNFDTAKSVWTRSIYGTYLIRPAHLRGEEPVHFLGQPDESPRKTVPPPAKSMPGTPHSTTK
jgi:hypothetical protein